jgi:uncharacterized phage protein (TIGR01671 family)
MNEIKFRIYNPEKKKIIESGATPMMLHSFFEHTAVLYTRDKMVYQQFTGLLDNNGVEIYMGDICEFENEDRFIVSMEDWLEVYAEWIGDPECEDQKRDLYRIGRSKVIGNIYENKDLIK